MQPQIMASLAGFMALAYFACAAAIILYVFRLLRRFVNANERTADALEIIANKFRDDRQT